MSLKLEFLRGSKVSSSITLNPGNTYRVGRDLACEIKVPEADVSGVHVRLTVDREGKVYLANMTRHQRTTFINKSAVGVGEMKVLSPGDEVTLGYSGSVAFALRSAVAESDMPSVAPSIDGETGYGGTESGEATNYAAVAVASVAAASAAPPGSINDETTPASVAAKLLKSAPDDLENASEASVAADDPLSALTPAPYVAPRRSRAAAEGRRTGRRAAPGVVPRAFLAASLLMIAAALAAVALHTRIGAGRAGNALEVPAQAVHGPRLLWYSGADYDTAKAKACFCLAGDDHREWKKGVLWLECAIMNARTPAQAKALRGKLRERGNAPLRKNVLALAESAFHGGEEFVAGSRATFDELGRCLK